MSIYLSFRLGFDTFLGLHALRLGQARGPSVTASNWLSLSYIQAAFASNTDLSLPDSNGLKPIHMVWFNSVIHSALPFRPKPSPSLLFTFSPNVLLLLFSPSYYTSRIFKIKSFIIIIFI